MSAPNNSTTILRFTRFEILAIIAIVLLAALVRAALFIGYQGFDDRTYVAYAWFYANGGDFAAANLVDPWVGRIATWMPMALAIRAFGGVEWALSFYSFAISLATFPILYLLGRHLFDSRAALFATALLALLPLDVFYATRAFADAAVGFWSFTAFALFVIAVDDHRKVVAFFAGLALGIAYLTKETVVLLAVPFALILLQRRKFPMTILVWMGLGSVIAVGAELIFWFASTGDPLYRWHSTLASRADFVVAPKPIQSWWDYIPGPMPHEIFRSNNTLIEAVLMFTTNDEWGLLYYFVFPLVAYGLLRGGRGEKTLALFILSIALLLLFVPLHFPSYTLNRDPRYYTMLSGAALLLFAAWSFKLRFSHRAIAVLVLVGTWIPCLYVGVVSSSMAMEKAFARWVKQNANETIWMRAFDASNVIVLSEFDPALNIGIVRLQKNKLADEPHQVLPSPLVAMRPDLPISPNVAALAGALVALPSDTVVPQHWQLATTITAPPNVLAESVRNVLATLKFPPKYIVKIAPSQGKSINIYRAG